MKQSLTWKTIRVRLCDLKEWDKNPVKISEHDAKHLAKSLDKFDHILPYVAAAPKNGSRKLPLLDGHQRKMVELQLRKVDPKTPVDVRVPSRKLTEKERAEIAVRLRKNTGEFDFDKLANFFEVPDLLEWGFTEKELLGAGFEFEDETSIKQGEETIPEQYAVLITCRNEQEQTELLERFITEGLKCRALLS